MTDNDIEKVYEDAYCNYAEDMPLEKQFKIKTEAEAHSACNSAGLRAVYSAGAASEKAKSERLEKALKLIRVYRREWHGSHLVDHARLNMIDDTAKKALSPQPEERTGG